MAKHLARDLEHLQARVLAMAAAVEAAVDKAAVALRTRDPKTAREVVAGDEAIDALENETQEECLKILALNQPVAGDLRRIAAVFSITTDLERIGDLAADVAERSVALAAHPAVPTPVKIDRMAALVAGMTAQALDAFVRLDAPLAWRVIRLDDEADRLLVEVIGELIPAMKADPAAVEPGVSLFSAARHLERIGDHATNIAEDVIYLIEGEVVRHRPEAARGGQ